METNSERLEDPERSDAHLGESLNKLDVPLPMGDRDPAPSNQSPAPTGQATKYWQKILPFADPLSVAAIFVYMLCKSWLRWLDPMIDFPDTLYFAWRLSEGDLLYKNLADWYGPLPHLTEAAGFRIFGVGLDTIVWMNIALTVGVLLLLRSILGMLGNRLTVWLSSLVFVVVFAFNHCTTAGNFNFITPYAGQTTYGFAGLLLVLWGLLREIKSGRPRWLGVAGLGVAVAYLDKPEPLLAAAGAVALYLVARMIQQARGQVQPNPGWNWLAALKWLAGGFSCLWLPVFFFFLAKGGLSYAILATDFVPHTLMDQSIRDSVSHSIFHMQVMGFDHPGENFRIQLLAGGMLVLVGELLIVLAWGWTRARLFGLAWWIRLATVIAVAVAAALGIGHENNLLFFWMNLGRALAFPVLLAAGAVVIWSFWSAWHKRADFSRTLALAVVGVAAALMLARMILNVTLYDTGFFMTPLAVCFLVQLMMVEAARPGPGSRRANGLLPAALAGIVLFGTGVVGLNSLQMYAKKTFPVGSGRDHFYAFPADISLEGPMPQTMINGFKDRTPSARTLVAFPQGIAVNYHLRIPNPLAVQVFYAGLQGFYGGAQQMLQDLQAHPPDVIFLHFRPYYQVEFGLKYFGDTQAGGSDILAWINDHYQNIANTGNAPGATSTGHIIDMYVPKAPLTLRATGPLLAPLPATN